MAKACLSNSKSAKASAKCIINKIVGRSMPLAKRSGFNVHPKNFKNYSLVKLIYEDRDK